MAPLIKHIFQFVAQSTTTQFSNLIVHYWAISKHTESRTESNHNPLPAQSLEMILQPSTPHTFDFDSAIPPHTLYMGLTRSGSHFRQSALVNVKTVVVAVILSVVYFGVESEAPKGIAKSIFHHRAPFNINNIRFQYVCLCVWDLCVYVCVCVLNLTLATII